MKRQLSTTVLSWNRRDLLRTTLLSYRETIGVPCEMIIVDNGSTDGSPELIKKFCAETPWARAVFLPSNLGGEAINRGLAESRAPILHISENDIEYLPGWDQKALDLFANFPTLGQLSLFGPVPTAGEAWKPKPALVRRANGRVLYEALGNVTTTCLLRRAIWDQGVRVHSLPEREGFTFPADAVLSTAVKRAGFMVAWADHYLVNNLGHGMAEFVRRPDYYRRNYRAKPWLGEARWQRRMAGWRERRQSRP